MDRAKKKHKKSFFFFMFIYFTLEKNIDLFTKFCSLCHAERRLQTPRAQLGH